MPIRDLNALHPWVRAKAERFVYKCRAGGQPVLIYETYRSPEDQTKKYLEGASEAKAGESPHQYGLAFDCVPYIVVGGAVTVNGDVWWDAPENVWEFLYAMGASCGLDPLGDKYGEYLPWDKGHMQEPGWRIVKDLIVPKPKGD